MCPALEVSVTEKTALTKGPYGAVTYLKSAEPSTATNSDHKPVIDGNICSYNIQWQCRSNKDGGNPNNPWNVDETPEQYQARLASIVDELATLSKPPTSIDVFCLQEAPNGHTVSAESLKEFNRLLTANEQLKDFTAISKGKGLFLLVRNSSYTVTEESITDHGYEEDRLQFIKLTPKEDVNKTPTTLLNMHGDMDKQEQTASLMAKCIGKGYVVAGDFNVITNNDFKSTYKQTTAEFIQKFKDCPESAGVLATAPHSKSRTIDGILRGDREAVAACARGEVPPPAKVVEVPPPTPVAAAPVDTLPSPEELKQQILAMKEILLDYDLMKKINDLAATNKETHGKYLEMFKGLKIQELETKKNMIPFLSSIIDKSSEEKNLVGLLLDLTVNQIAEPMTEHALDIPTGLTDDPKGQLKKLLPELDPGGIDKEETPALPPESSYEFTEDIHTSAVALAYYREYFPHYTGNSLSDTYDMIDNGRTAVHFSGDTMVASDGNVTDAYSDQIPDNFWKVVAKILEKENILPQTIRLISRANHSKGHWTCVVTEVNLDGNQFKNIQKAYAAAKEQQSKDKALTLNADHIGAAWRGSLEPKTEDKYQLPITKLELSHYDSSNPGTNANYFNFVEKSCKKLQEANPGKVTIINKKCTTQTGNECGDWATFNGFVAGVLGKDPATMFKDNSRLRDITRAGVAIENARKTGNLLAAEDHHVVTWKKVTDSIFKHYEVSPQSADVSPLPSVPPAVPVPPLPAPHKPPTPTTTAVEIKSGIGIADVDDAEVYVMASSIDVEHPKDFVVGAGALLDAIDRQRPTEYPRSYDILVADWEKQGKKHFYKKSYADPTWVKQSDGTIADLYFTPNGPGGTKKINIIHAVVPKLTAGTPPTEEQKTQYKQAYKQSIQMAIDASKTSIAITPLGIGVYRWPGTLAGQLAAEAINEVKAVNQDTFKGNKFKIIVPLFDVSSTTSNDYLFGTALAKGLGLDPSIIQVNPAAAPPPKPIQEPLPPGIPIPTPPPSLPVVESLVLKGEPEIITPCFANLLKNIDQHNADTNLTTFAKQKNDHTVEYREKTPDHEQQYSKPVIATVTKHEDSIATKFADMASYDQVTEIVGDIVNASSELPDIELMPVITKPNSQLSEIEIKQFEAMICVLLETPEKFPAVNLQKFSLAEVKGLFSDNIEVDNFFDEKTGILDLKKLHSILHPTSASPQPIIFRSHSSPPSPKFGFALEKQPDESKPQPPTKKPN